ncbi:hypothetical protein [Acaryochloris marina]|uniref:hypothetical protein n=1 Tax=Acaryochloris marina TaxID=155978 RepID=UPI002016A821|nr:hypothetical protein [Acaryochloris marina]
MKSSRTCTSTWPHPTPVTSYISQAWWNLSLWLQPKRNRRIALALLFGILIVLHMATHAHADFAEDLISDLEPSAAHDGFWDELWQATFDRSKGLDGQTNRIAFGAVGTVVRWVTLFALFVVLLHYGSGMMQAGPSITKGTVFSIKSIIPVVVILVLLANNFAGVHAVGLFINQVRLGIIGEAYVQTEFATTFRSAIKDAYLTEKYRESIAFRTKQCNLIETPITTIPSLEEPTNPDTPLTDEQRQYYKKLQCIQSMTAYIQSLQEEVAAECEKGCVGTNIAVATDLKKYGVDGLPGFVTENLDTFVIPLQKMGELASDAAKHGSQETYRLIFRAIQWVWTTFLNMGFYLTAVAAPITYAISLMPTKRHFLFDLNLFALMMFSLAEFGNILCIGIVALMLQKPTLVELGGYIFPLTYGLLAPLVSASMFYGGFKAASSFRGGALGMAGAAGGIAGGIASSAMIASRNRREQAY